MARAKKPKRGPKGLTLLEGSRANGLWRVRVWAVDPKTGRPREVQRRVRGSEDDATAERLRIKAEVEAGGAAAGAPSLRNYAASWMRVQAPRLRPTSAKTTADGLARAVEYVGPDVLIDRVTVSDVEAAANAMRRDGLTAGTANRSVRYLLACVAAWYADHGAPSPLAAVRHLRAERRSSPNRLTAHQAAWVVALSKHDRYPPWLHPVVVACIITGARIGEVLALRWEDIDTAGDVLHIRRSAANSMTMVLPTKTGEPRRVGLHPMLVQTLTAWRQHMVAQQVAGVESGWCFPGLLTKRRAADCPMGYRAASRWWARLCDDLGIEGVRLHGLRRTHMDLARLAGVNAVVTRAMVGHADAAETERYSTVDDAERRAAAAEVVSILTGRR